MTDFVSWGTSLVSHPVFHRAELQSTEHGLPSARAIFGKAVSAHDDQDRAVSVHESGIFSFRDSLKYWFRKIVDSFGATGAIIGRIGGSVAGSALGMRVAVLMSVNPVEGGLLGARYGAEAGEWVGRAAGLLVGVIVGAVVAPAAAAGSMAFETFHASAFPAA
ncbi:MAG: hypothetical protein ACOYJQ_09375 [Pseudochelatococcus sp.]|uniref:hypothetical protein n=1 Tax=Pseudochelatococcus sp. TaxID=2020869 RepID=UPI003D8F9C12